MARPVVPPRRAAAVKGVEGINCHQVIGERVEPARITRGPLVGRDRELARLQKSRAHARAGAAALRSRRALQRPDRSGAVGKG